MADILLPPWLSIARNSIRYIDSTGASFSPFNGVVRTASRGGDRMGAGMEFSPVGGSSLQPERAALIAFLNAIRGRQNRPILWDHSYQQQGSFPAPELLSNNSFANGTTGFAANSAGTISVNSRLLRVARTGVSGSLTLLQNVSGLTASAAYALRIMTNAGAGLAQVPGTLVNGSITTTVAGTGYGYYATGGASDQNTSRSVGLFEASSSGYIAGDYFTVPWMSYSRCMLVDNAPNLLLQSDSLNNVAWTPVNVTIAANAAAAPDQTVTGDQISEDSAVGTKKFVTQSATVAATALDYCAYAWVKRGTRNFCFMQINEGGGSSIRAHFDLLNGTIGTTAVLGSNWSGVRAFMRDMGNAWYLCQVIGRKTSASTALTLELGPANADASVTYTGTGGAAMFALRLGLAQSSLPTRGAATTSTALANGTLQSLTSTLYVAGLPPTSTGLLLPADMVEITTSRGPEPKFVTAPLSSDAAGLGVLQFEPPIRFAPPHGSPVIVNQPMGRFILTSDVPNWSNEPGRITTASAEFAEN